MVMFYIYIVEKLMKYEHKLMFDLKRVRTSKNYLLITGIRFDIIDFCLE